MKKIFLILPFILFGIDRLIKYFIPNINLGDDFISFALYKNYAGAFSLPIAGTLYNGLAIILLFLFIFLFIKEIKPNKTFAAATVLLSKKLRITAYCLIIFGGVSNLFDRLYFGYVIDYINFFDIGFFNLADGMIFLAVGMLIAEKISNKKQEAKIKRQEAGNNS